MSYNPYGGKYTYGGSLKHYRTKGSKNGVSNNPSYKPIGQKAVGRIVGTRPDGTPIYDYGRRSGESTQIRNERRQNNVQSALNSYSNSRSQSTRDRANQQRRINAATATNAGSRGISSREAAQRQGSRINANQYGNTIGNRVGRTADAIGANARKTANDTKKFVQNTVKNAPETAAKAAKDTRNIFQRGASAVGNWFNKRRAELKTTGKNVGNWLSDRGRDIGKAARTAYEAVSNSDERRAYEKAQANFRKNPTAENKKARDAAKKAYDSHLLTRLDRGVKGAPGNISRTARNAGEFISTTARNAAGTAKRGVEAAGRAISNQDEREAYERAEANFRKNPTAENRRARNEAKKAYDSHLVTQASRTATKAGQTVGRAASAVGSAAAEGATKAANSATKLASSASSAVNKVITDARKMAGNTVPGASDINKLYDNYKQANQLYNDLLKTDPKAAHKIESKVEDMRKAYVKAESQFNNSTEGKISNTISGKSKYMNRRK